MANRAPAVLAAAIALAGCVPAQRGAVEEFDAAYLARTPDTTRVAFEISFFNCGAADSDIIEAAWSRAAAGEDKLSALWGENGLRAGFVGEPDVKALKAVLAKLPLRRLNRHEMFLPEFDITLGGRAGQIGVVYADEKGKAYRDVVDPVVAVSVKVSRGKEGLRMLVSPFLAEGDKPPVRLAGLGAEYPVHNGAVVLLGPVREPPELTLGSMLCDAEGAGAQGAVVLVEMRVSR